jgi:hypothetical protein
MDSLSSTDNGSSLIVEDELGRIRISKTFSSRPFALRAARSSLIALAGGQPESHRERR